MRCYALDAGCERLVLHECYSKPIIMKWNNTNGLVQNDTVDESFLVTNYSVNLSPMRFDRMKLTEGKIQEIIKAKGNGFVFTTKYFSSKADDVSVVTSALSRLVQKNVIRRLAHGLYDLPEVHPRLGEVMPSTAKVIDAIVKSEALQVQPTGAYAANLLGLSTQIPMRIELYTNGPKKCIRYGKQEILLRPTTPKNMIGAGTKAGLILHALRQIGKDNVSDDMIRQIKNQLEEKDAKQLMKQAQYAPTWIAKIMRELIKEI